MIKFEDYLVSDFDSTANGNKAVGVPVTIYFTGTKNRAPLFDDEGNVIVNPVKTDDAGRYTFNLDVGTYDIVTDAGTDKEFYLYTKYEITADFVQAKTYEFPPISGLNLSLPFNAYYLELHINGRFQPPSTYAFAIGQKDITLKNPVKTTDTVVASFTVLGDAGLINENKLILENTVDITKQNLSSYGAIQTNRFENGYAGGGTWVNVGNDASKSGQVEIYDDLTGTFGCIYDAVGTKFFYSSEVKDPVALGAKNKVITDADQNVSDVLESNRKAFKALENYRGKQQIPSGFFLLKEPVYIRPLTTFLGASKGNGSSGKLTSEFNANNGATVFVPHSSFDMVNFQDSDGETYVINVEDFPQTTPDANPNLNRFNDGYAGGIKYGNFQVNLADFAGGNSRVAKIENLGGVREYRPYDSASSHDINVLWHGNGKSYKWDSENFPTLRVSQSNERRALFSLGDDVERIEPVALCRRQQESQFYGLKLLAAPQGTPRNAPCLVVEDSRAVEFYSPAFASVKDNDFVKVNAVDRTCSNINFYSPTVENGVGTTYGFRFKGFNGNVVAQCSIKAPREEAPQSTRFLVCDSGCVAGDFDIGQRWVIFEDGSESNFVFSKNGFAVEDNNPTGRNQVIAAGNKNDMFEIHKQPIRLWQSDQLSPTFELAAGSDPNTLKKFRIQYDANDNVNLGATFRDLDSGHSWVFDANGFMQSPSGFKTIDTFDSTVRQITLSGSNIAINGAQKTGGASGTFTSNDGKTITVTDGRITRIV